MKNIFDSAGIVHNIPSALKVAQARQELKARFIVTLVTRVIVLGISTTAFFAISPTAGFVILAALTFLL